ncbi:hypothetical protein V495_05928 [Pseudogymnoascus sp. VKM F-4514 (FW-929)]|nr:hypothetical protein V490_01548 [Pseudogymnoascus sp. VKM F-3557]KFY39468.1 hypothetical protein V495_05928 [Pseudogymnoascus sp. VKM F-4514 (FW-929)]KFY61962.1 hypothetical protein V497_02666 [Pseudogymnoascus sp. VKM F-4516 (FW-969)]
MSAMDIDVIPPTKAETSVPERPRKKIKTSELPLSSATRSAIESLSHTFKKKGNYDALRKQVWETLQTSDFETNLIESITKVAENELEVNQSLLSSSRGKAAILIEGVIDRSGIYQEAEAHIKRLLEDHVGTIEDGIRAIRRDDVGEEAAAEEEARGSKTDDQYAEEAATRRNEREKLREELREKERAIAEERRKIEKARKREEERKREAEEDKRREEREARRKLERESERERDRLRGRDYSRDRSRDGGRRKRMDDSRERKPTAKANLSREEVDRLEQEALAMLMKEGKRTSQRSRHQLEPEVDETLAPPPRKAMPASAIKPISRDAQTKKEASTKASTGGAPKSSSHAADEMDLDGKEKRVRARSRSRDPGHSRRDSRDRGGYSRRSSRDRDDRRDRSRDRADARDKERSTRRDSRDRDDRRRRDSRDTEDRRRRDSRDRERSVRDHRDRDSRRDRDISRDPRDDRRSYRDRDMGRDSRYRSRTPPRRDFKTAEEKKQEAVKQRELEAKAYLAAQQEAREKGLPIPGLDKPKSDGFARPNWRSRDELPDSRKRDADSAGLGSSSLSRKRESSARSPSRASSIRRDRSPVAVSSRSPVIKRETSTLRDVDRHGAVAALTDGREVEMRGATRTELGAEAEAAAATGGRMSEGIEAGAAIEILRGDTGVGAEAGIGIGMIGDRLADTERRCHCLNHGL